MLLLQEFRGEELLREEEISVHDRPISIGRGQRPEQCGVPIGADFPPEVKRLISRTQATLELSALGLLIRDGNGNPSQSGIRINDELVDSDFLEVGDEVTLFAIGEWRISLTYQKEIAVDRHREPRTGEYFNAIKVFDERSQHMQSQIEEIKQSVDQHRETFRSAIEDLERRIDEKSVLDEQQSATVASIAKQVRIMLFSVCAGVCLWGLMNFASGLAEKEQELYRKKTIDIVFLVLEKPEFWTVVIGGGTAVLVKQAGNSTK